MAQDKETAVISHMIYCLPSVDVDPPDRVILGSRTFLVVSVQHPSNLTVDGVKQINVREIDYDI